MGKAASERFCGLIPQADPSMAGRRERIGARLAKSPTARALC